MDQVTLTETVKKLAAAEEARQAAIITETQIRVVAAIFDKSAAYSNLMLVGGYAGFFGLWQLAKDYLSKPQALSAALLMLISITFFVVFEIVKMASISRLLLKKDAVLRPLHPRPSRDEILRDLHEVDTAHAKQAGRYMRFWAVSFSVAVGSASIAALILGYSFICGLISG